MAVLDVIVGYVRGLKGDTGETGATGATGEAATVSVGTVSTAAYGQQAQVTNVGTSGAAVFDFVIPEGRPGEVLVDMSNLTNNTITTSTSKFPVPAVGDTGATMWGKVVKFFSDIRSAVNAKIDSSKITTSLAVTTTGSVADATVSKILNDKINAFNDSFKGVISSGSTITSLNSATETGFYTIMNSAADKPVTGLAFGYVLVNRGSEGSVIQTVIGRAADNVTVFHFERFSSNGGSSWGSWLPCIAQKIETTISVPSIAASGSAQVTLTGYGRSVIPHAIIVRDNRSGRPMIASNWWASGNGLEIIIFNLGTARVAATVTLEMIF